MSELKYIGINELANKKIMGRTDLTGENIPLFYNGSGVEVNVTGSELWIDIETDSSYYEPWVCTLLNGSLMQRQMVLPGTYSICLFRSMDPAGIKNIRFIRELQAMSDDNLCKLVIKGFKYDGEFLPVSDRKYKIEFIGDSITSGEGTYGAKQDSEWLSMYMSFSNTYPFMVGEKLDADVRCLSQGGWGIYCGWDHDLTHTIPGKYEKICLLGEDNKSNHELGALKDYDFDSWKTDAIVLNLGTNDNSGLNTVKNSDGTYNEEIDLFRRESNLFLKKLRKCNPSAHIVWAFGMLGDEIIPNIKRVIDEYKAETGDENVAFLKLSDTTEETKGAHGHPGVMDHCKAAGVISDYLKSVLK